MDKCREEFQKAFPIPAHWIEFDEKANRYYCPYVADATASTYQSKWVVWQHQQAKVEELQTQLSLQRQRVKAFEEELTSSRNYGDELQKRVDELEFQLKDWKQKSMPAMLNGMCGRCGKEPLQGIGSDKEDYALLHCFGCGANKYEWIGEQALKGEG